VSRGGLSSRQALRCEDSGRAYAFLKVLVPDNVPKSLIMLAAPLREEKPGAKIYVRLPTVVVKVSDSTDGVPLVT
jgi:hypothetical protein